jgi:L-ascorbate metabolism protein UlaG (beta-lactamase superfamily)
MTPESLVDVDAILLTHTHFDHWDQAAQRLLPKSLPVFCQPADVKILKAQGFTSLRVVTQRGQEFAGGLNVRMFPGEHGSGLLGRLMGASAGYVLQAHREPVLCLTGDTVWCPALAKALKAAQPNVVVMYAGAARFNVGKAITLDTVGIDHIARAVPQAELVAVHMEAINHCRLLRAELAAYAQTQPWEVRLHIPYDGETCAFS